MARSSIASPACSMRGLQGTMMARVTPASEARQVVDQRSWRLRRHATRGSGSESRRTSTITAVAGLRRRSSTTIVRVGTWCDTTRHELPERWCRRPTTVGRPGGQCDGRHRPSNRANDVGCAPFRHPPLRVRRHYLCPRASVMVATRHPQRKRAIRQQSDPMAPSRTPNFLLPYASRSAAGRTPSSILPFAFYRLPFDFSSEASAAHSSTTIRLTSLNGPLIIS